MDVEKKIILFFCILLSGLQQTTAQSLDGKVIYVSQSQTINLKFRSLVKNYNLGNKDAINQFDIRPIGNFNIQLNCSNPDFKPVDFFVYEGDNTHRFILRYKEVLTESNYNFTDKAALRREAQQLMNNPAVKEPDQPPVRTDTPKIQPQRVKPPASPTTPVAKAPDDLFDATVSKANKALAVAGYDEAEKLYNAALLIRPNNEWCTLRLKEIGNLKAEAKRMDQQKLVEQAYQRHKIAGDSAFSKKAYDVAIPEYTQALQQKPGDPYLTAQLKKIEQLQKDDKYLNYMKIGRDDLSRRLFDNAELAFNEALKIKPNDADANKELVKVSAGKTALLKTQQEEKKGADLQARYKDSLYLASNKFDAGKLEDAKKTYGNAGKMMPGDTYPARRIASIDSILAKRKTDVSKMKQDSLNTARYNSEMDKGNKALESKDINKAKAAFQLARTIRPEENAAAARLAEIDDLRLKADEGKKAEAARKAQQDSVNRQYSAAMSRGAAAKNKKDYSAAKEFLIKATVLKPGEKLAADQLEEVNGKLAEIAADNRYNHFMHLGDSNVNALNYSGSIRWYDSAGAVRPNELAPQKRSLAANRNIFKQDSIAKEVVNTKLRNEKYDQVIEIYRKANIDRLDKRTYPEAYKGFRAFLTQVDLSNVDKYGSTQQANIKEANRYLNILEPYYRQAMTEDSIRNARQLDSLNNLKGKKRKKARNTAFHSDPVLRTALPGIPAPGIFCGALVAAPASDATKRYRHSTAKNYC